MFVLYQGQDKTINIDTENTDVSDATDARFLLLVGTKVEKTLAAGTVSVSGNVITATLVPGDTANVTPGTYELEAWIKDSSAKWFPVEEIHPDNRVEIKRSNKS